MSRNINVNPAHYKVAGRERQGEDIDQAAARKAYAQERSEIDRWQARQERLKAAGPDTNETAGTKTGPGIQPPSTPPRSSSVRSRQPRRTTRKAATTSRRVRPTRAGRTNRRSAGTAGRSTTKTRRTRSKPRTKRRQS